MELFETATTAEMVVGGLDILAMFMSAVFGWFSSVLAFGWGLLVALKPSKTYGYDATFFMKIVIAPFLYLFFGLIIHEFMRAFIDWWYSANMNKVVMDFYEFSINKVSLDGYQRFSPDNLQAAIDGVKMLFLGSAVFIYLLIIMFYAYHAFHFIRIKPKKEDSGGVIDSSAFAKIMFFFATIVFGMVVLQTYDTVVSLIMLPDGVVMDNIGEVNKVSDVFRKYMIFFAKTALEQDTFSSTF